jgi:hypothetical protein
MWIANRVTGNVHLVAIKATIGRGLLAGAIGTAAMTASSTIEEKLRKRPASTAPADAAAKVLGIGEFPSDSAKNAFSNAVHWSYGTGWGLVRALLSTRLSPPAATATHLAALWGTEQVVLPALGVAPPITEWGGDEIAIDLAHHVVYATTTGISCELLNGRR